MAEPARVRPGMLALAALAALAAAPVAWPDAIATPLLAVALTAALGYAPGAIAAPLLLPRAGVAGRTLFALCTAPFITGAVAALAMALGAAPGPAARALLAAVALAALVASRRPAARDVEHEGAAPWLAAVLWAALVAALLFGNPWLAPRFDGTFHAAVTLQVAERGLPPEDPYFAGLRLLYFWGYHVWAALWLAVAPRLTVWAPLLALNLTGALAVVLGVCLLARRLGADARGMAAAAAVAILGYAPFSWLWIGVRAVTGDVVGPEEIRRLVAMGATPPMQIMSTWTLHSSMAFFGDKYLVLTPFALGLAQFTLVLLVLLEFIERPRPREGVTLALSVGAAMFIHSVVGWSAALIAGVWWWWALWRARRTGNAARGALLGLPLAFAAAVVTLLPYLAATTLGKQKGVAPGFSPHALGTWLLSGMLIVPAGMAWLWRERARRTAAGHLLVFAVALTASGLSLSMSGNNQSKFFNLLFLLLAAPAGLMLVDLYRRAPDRRRRALTAVLTVAVAPTVLLAMWAFATERAQLGDDWEHPRPGERVALAWAAAHTEPGTIFVDSRFSLDLPASAGRSVMSGGEPWEKIWGYAPRALDLRRRATAELGALGEASGEVRALLADLGRPVLVTVRRRWEEPGDPGRWARMLAAPHPGYRLVYRNDDLAFFRWEGTR